MSRSYCLSKQECDNVCYLINEILGIYNELIVTQRKFQFMFERFSSMQKKLLDVFCKNRCS